MKETAIHPLRKGRASLEGQPYLLTTVTADRVRIFANFAAACVAARTLAGPQCWPRSALLAWVLMPDHLHLLLTLGAGETLDILMSRVKGLVSNRLRQELGIADVWQSRYHDRAIRNDESLADAARYVIANPIRAGLVADVGDYPFWDCVWLDAALQPTIGRGFNPRRFL